MIGNSNDEINFQHKLLLTDIQVSKIRKVFANRSSANIKFSKTQLSIVVKYGGILRGISFFGNILLTVAEKETDLGKYLGKNISRKANK